MISLNHDGFVMSYLYAINVEPYSTKTEDRNQLKLEAKLRREIVRKKEEKIEKKAYKVGDVIEGAVFKPYYSHGNIFLDKSDFYSSLSRIRLYAETSLYAKEDINVKAVLWSYMASAIYLEGELQAEIIEPNYKPIEKIEFTMSLKKGQNDIFIISDNLGVRDSRNIIALQILDSNELIETSIADKEFENEYISSLSFLDSIKIERGGLRFEKKAPDGTKVELNTKSVDYYERHKEPIAIDISGLYSIEISKDYESCSVVLNNGLKRSFEFSERIMPEKLEKGDGHFRAIMQKIANITMLDRGSDGFSIFSLLARKYLKIEKGDEKKLLLNDIKQIKERVDCSDFLLNGLFRYIHEYGLDKEAEQDALDAILNYRYWMSEEGSDAMCFWSENHSLMFYFASYDAGRLFPDKYFNRAKMYGRDLSEYGKRRLREWLDDVLSSGFEEFLSTTYMCVTFAILLNVIDYGEKEDSLKAEKCADLIFKSLAESTFHGSIIAPMGRVYRGVIYPFREAAGSLMNLVNEDAYYSYGEGWLAFYATSKYRYPEDLKSLMESEINKRYATGNAEVVIEKKDSYMLTSVSSPRYDSFKRWENTINDPKLDAEDNGFIKSLNECFHGTTCFQSGVYGYQQHMFSAALSEDALIFINHPGSTSEDNEMRPGYWNGNGIMPAVIQREGFIAAIYSISDSHPVKFSHIYIPQFRFDSVIKKDKWIFLEKNKGYLAIWISAEALPYDDVIKDSELRVYGKNSAYFILAGEKDSESFEEFQHRAEGLNIAFDETTLTLYKGQNEILKFKEYSDETQFIK